MTTRLELDAAVYSLEAVQKAAYRFIDRLTILISQGQGTVICELDSISGAQIPTDDVPADFKRELLDQQLRIQIKRETEPTRNLILAYAFSRTGLQK